MLTQFIGLRAIFAGIVLFSTVTGGIAFVTAFSSGAETVKAPAIPKGKESDIKFYAADGRAIMGRDALEQMPKANVVLWLAGNQFFAMDEVVHAFQKQQASTTVGLITLPGTSAASNQSRRLGLCRERISWAP